jgi:hypothetical protein
LNEDKVSIVLTLSSWVLGILIATIENTHCICPQKVYRDHMLRVPTLKEARPIHDVTEEEYLRVNYC